MTTRVPIKIEKDGMTYDLHVMWSIHNKCNYQCSYCPPALNSGNFSGLKLENLKGFIDRIEKHYAEKLGFKNILFSFTGGEPTLWPDFREFIKYIEHKGFRLGLTTNASVGLNYWNQISTYFDYICLSFHPESADVDSFLKTFEYLHNADKTVIPSVRVMMHPDQKLWNKSIELVDKLKKYSNWTYECVHILDDYGMESNKIDYKDSKKVEFLEQNAFNSQFKDNSTITEPSVKFNYKITYKNNEIEKLDENKLINDGSANFRGWNCFIGLEQLYIHSNGLIKRAGCNVGPWLGTIAEYESINFPERPIKCQRDNCFCPTDIRISKFAPGVEFENYNIEHDMEVSEINVTDSNFKKRLDISIDKELADPNRFFAGISKLISELVGSLQLAENEILINICYNTPNLYIEELLRFVDQTPGIISLEIGPEASVKSGFVAICQEVFDKVTINVLGFNNFSVVSELLKLSQENLHNLFHVKIHRTEGSMREIADFLGALYKYYAIVEFLNVDPIEIAQIKKLNWHVNEMHYCSKRKSFHYKKLAIDYNNIDRVRELSLVDDVSVKTKDGQIRNINHHSFPELIDFKNWQCFMGIDNLFINSSGEIKTSGCFQGQSMGTIWNFNLKQIFRSKIVVCEQSSCVKKCDKFIKKIR